MPINSDISHETIEKITGEQLRALRTEELEGSIYDKEFIENLEENDEISTFEGGFMCGYLAA